MYPPFLGAGIRVSLSSNEPLAYRVEMPLTRWNRNAVGTQFGGSLFMMCDPFYMLILREALGPDFVVWDKKSAIDFVKPGRSRVSAEFSVPGERVASILAEVNEDGVSRPVFTVAIVDDDGALVAKVEKELHVRRKRSRR